MSPPTTCRQSSRKETMSPPTTRHQSSRNTLGVPPTSPPPIVVRDVRETTLWRRGKPLKKKQYPGQGKVDDRKHPPKSKVDDRKHPPGGGGGGGGDRGVGGVCGGDDVRGDERTTNDVGAAAVKSVEHGVVGHRSQRVGTALWARLSDGVEGWSWLCASASSISLAMASR